MKNKLLVGTVLLASIMFFSQCTKDVPGPKGEAGDTGPAGPQGPQGPQGVQGNANVKSMNLTATSWSWDSFNYWREAEWSISILTYSIVNSGAVMLYQKYGNDYIALPISQSDGAGVTEEDWFQYGVGQLLVVIANSDLSDPNPPSFDYKLVCIESSAIKQNPNLDLKNYSEVKKIFNLKD